MLADTHNSSSIPEHSPSLLELCFWWGRSRLRDNAGTQETACWESALQQGMQTSASVFGELLDAFNTQVYEGLEELEDDLTLDLDPFEAEAAGYGLMLQKEPLKEEGVEANMYIWIARYLHTLDDAVALGHAARHCPCLQDSPLRGRMLEIAEQVKTFNFAYRLIPLNPMRQSALEQVLPEYHALFPWYDEWNHVPEDSLLLLAQYRAGKPVTAIEPEVLEALWLEIMADEPMREEINDKAAIIRLLPTALDHAYAFRWLEAAEACAVEGEMPEEVVRGGMKGAAIRVAVRAILDGRDPLEWRFQAGFCGIGLMMEVLTRDQRITALKPIELIIREEGYVPWQGTSAEELRRWCNREIDDNVLSDRLFNQWIKELRMVVGKPFINLFAEEIIYWLLLRMEDEPSLLLAQAIDHLDMTLSQENIRHIAQLLYKAAQTESTAEGFLSLTAWLCGETTSPDNLARALYEQWQEAEPRIAQLQLESAPEPADTLEKLLPVSLTLLRVFQYIREAPSQLSKHAVSLRDAIPSCLTLPELLNLQFEGLVQRADSGAQSCQVNIAYIQDGSIQDIVLCDINIRIFPEENGMVVVGTLPDGLNLREKVQWICDWLLPDGSRIRPSKFDSDGPRFKALFIPKQCVGTLRLGVGTQGTPPLG